MMSIDPEKVGLVSSFALAIVILWRKLDGAVNSNFKDLRATVELMRDHQRTQDQLLEECERDRAELRERVERLEQNAQDTE